MGYLNRLCNTYSRTYTIMYVLCVYTICHKSCKQQSGQKRNKTDRTIIAGNYEAEQNGRERHEWSLETAKRTKTGDMEVKMKGEQCPWPGTIVGPPMGLEKSIHQQMMNQTKAKSNYPALLMSVTESPKHGDHHVFIELLHRITCQRGSAKHSVKDDHALP
jgi:hypothetical protein